MSPTKWIVAGTATLALVSGALGVILTSAEAAGLSDPSVMGGSAITVGSRSPGPAANSNDTARSTPVSLSTWAGLLLPINAHGQLSGKDAMDVSPARLYQPWLTQTSAGALEFWAPAGAATTPGSTHSRTELESSIEYDVGKQKHTLSATLEILQLPKSNPEISVAQLHAGGPGGSSPFLMINFKAGRLYVMVATGTSAGPSFYTMLTGIDLDTTFSYQLTDNRNGTLTFSASSGSQHQSYTEKVPPAEYGNYGHFSAGDYQQGTVSEGTNDGGKVLFTSLNQG